MLVYIGCNQGGSVRKSYARACYAPAGVKERCLKPHPAHFSAVSVGAFARAWNGAVVEVEGKVVSAARLYRAVGLRGGFDNVSSRDWWRSIGQEFGTSAAGDSIWQTKYALLLETYENKFLDASKYTPCAEEIVTAVHRQNIFKTDSPAGSPLEELQSSSSSSCLNRAGPSQQSGPTMESSATAGLPQDKSGVPRRHSLAQNTEAMSSMSNGRPTGSTDDTQAQWQPPGSLLRPPEASDLPAASQKQQGSELQAMKPETQLTKQDVAPKANGSLHTEDEHELEHKQQVSQAAAAEPHQVPTLPAPPSSSVPTPAVTPKRLHAGAPPVCEQAGEPAHTSSLPSGAYMVPYPTGTLSASPQTSPLHVPAMQPPSVAQQPSQPPQQPPQQLQHQQTQQQLHHQQIQQQQQLMQQRQYHQMLLQRQAQLQQASLQRPQTQQGTAAAAAGRPPLQHPFMLHQPQPARSSAPPVMQPRVAQPVWPVPLPRAATGMKRSASGEVASASAKKQKTTPLAAYQQAQEHLRAHMARQGSQHAEQRQVAEDLLKSIAPSLGPLLSVPSGFETSHANEIQLALRSGVHSSVAWSLNVLTVLSFNATHPLLLSQHSGLLQALLEVLVKGLEDECMPTVDYEECLTPAERLLPGRHPQPKPGEPQGWWWEREEGLLAPQPGAGWAFTHACCAGNILRNLAMQKLNHAALVDCAAVAALVRCLEARQEQPCPDTNDLALNALDCLHKVAAGLLLSGLPSQLRSALLAGLCRCMAAHDTPLRVRMSAAQVIQDLAQEPENQGPLAQAAEDGELAMLERLSMLLRVDTVQAQQQLHQELAGSCGRPDTWAERLSQKERQAMALTLQAQVLADAAKAVSGLVRYQEVRLKQAVASNRHLMVSLIQTSLSRHMQHMEDWHKTSSEERLKDGLHVHVLGHFRNAVQYSIAVLINISGLPAAQEKLRIYEIQIAELAMTECPQKEPVAVLLSRIGPAPD